jgi:hypothetical protein
MGFWFGKDFILQLIYFIKVLQFCDRSTKIANVNGHIYCWGVHNFSVVFCLICPYQWMFQICIYLCHVIIFCTVSCICSIWATKVRILLFWCEAKLILVQTNPIPNLTELHLVVSEMKHTNGQIKELPIYKCIFVLFAKNTQRLKKICYLGWFGLHTFIITIFEKRNSHFFPFFTRTMFNLSISVLFSVHIVW